MNKFLKILLSIILILIFLAAVALVVYLRAGAVPAAEPEPEPTATPTPTPTPTPEPEYYTISFVGDNTLASSNLNSSFANTINGDMAYPYANTLKFFKDDDLTIANLECVFSDQSLQSGEMFYFKSPTTYAQILVEGSVEFVTTANNHARDFGDKGYIDTCNALNEYKISHAGENETAMYETESGLKVGIYCAYNSASVENVQAAIQSLKENGAEYIICALHWGEEGVYKPSDKQTSIAHAAIDAGANIVYGSHPHVLQPVEEYNNGVIFYSMGNWSFGGNTTPKDMDTAIAQVTVKRDLDGTISTDTYTLTPCSMSSSAGYNDFKPTPYDADSDGYKRAMSKLDGSYTGGNLSVDYSFMSPSAPAPAPAGTPSPVVTLAPIETQE